ncbi:MAG: hypothetical protein L0226_15795 [Acidobacteria bacterium]|nr:hypothetical protein [Acidobacteriota bacterium]
MINGTEKPVVNYLTQLGTLLCVLLLLAPGISAQKAQRKRVVVPPPEPQITQKEIDELSEAASKSRATLIEASQTYRESLERLLALQKQEEERVAAIVEKDRGLLEMGLIPKRQFEESEQNLAEAQSKSAETQRQIGSVDHLVAEVRAAEELAKMPTLTQGATRSTAMLIRYVGKSRWAMTDLEKIDAFFRLKFGRVLPVSAFGQTATHSHLGFDHHDAIDVAVHPDTVEGQELIDYLRSQGISFIAIRGSIPGSATGAHIHIGPPSRRIISQQ